MKKCFLLVITTILLVAMVACTTTTPEKVGTKNASATNTGESKSDESKPAETKTYKIGDVIKMGNLQVTVNSAEIVKPDKINTPQDSNNYFLFVDTTVENLGDTPLTISSMLMFQVVDKDGRALTMTYHTKQKGNLDGELGSGRKMTGQLVYEIPKAAKVEDYELIFEPDVLGFGQAIIKLTK